MSFLDRFNLGHGYRKYFCIHAASTEALRDEVFRIRHEVYCEDLGFEAVRADGRERDDYDDQSVHCLLRSRNDPPAPVGCARLVLTREGDRDQPLPFERTCAASIDRSIIDPVRLPRERIAEVSRLAVRAAYRRRKTDVDHRLIHDEDFRSDAQPRFPYIPISLYLGAVALAERHGIDTLFVLTEPRLAAHFARLGVEIRQIGAPVEHRGTRIPSMMDVRAIIADMRILLRPIWRAVREDIERGAEG